MTLARCSTVMKKGKKCDYHGDKVDSGEVSFSVQMGKIIVGICRKVKEKLSRGGKRMEFSK